MPEQMQQEWLLPKFFLCGGYTRNIVLVYMWWALYPQHKMNHYYTSLLLSLSFLPFSYSSSSLSLSLLLPLPPPPSSYSSLSLLPLLLLLFLLFLLAVLSSLQVQQWWYKVCVAFRQFWKPPLCGEWTEKVHPYWAKIRQQNRTGVLYQRILWRWCGKVSFGYIHASKWKTERFVRCIHTYRLIWSDKHANFSYRVDMTKYPGLAEVPWLIAEVRAGDCLYIPMNWIHQVKTIKQKMIKSEKYNSPTNNYNFVG